MAKTIKKSVDRCPTCGRAKVRQGLTPGQAETLKMITAFIKKDGYAPSHKEMAEEKGTTVSNINRYVASLEERGHIRRGLPGKPRTISIV